MISLDDKHNDKALQGEIRRMSGLRQYPTSIAAKAELKTALATAKTLRHARASIDRIMESATFCPTPAEIRQAVDATPADICTVNCDLCGGSGWYHIEMENSVHGCMVCCTCAAGDLKRSALVGKGARVIGGRG